MTNCRHLENQCAHCGKRQSLEKKYGHENYNPVKYYEVPMVYNSHHEKKMKKTKTCAYCTSWYHSEADGGKLWRQFNYPTGLILKLLHFKKMGQSFTKRLSRTEPFSQSKRLYK
uniref:Uncharacterized protein n=1 Tax=Wuchereria bancrofti TaxID=6293 RepID=A0A1I8EGH3_WUCBA